MSKINITKAKVLNKEIAISYYVLNEEGKKIKYEVTDNSEPHKDLKDSMDSLSAHAAFIAEFIDANEFKSAKKSKGVLEKYPVKGFSLSGEDNDNIMINAQKQLSTGEMLGFNTPSRSLDTEAEEPYPFAEDLQKYLDKCIDELREYLNGKHAPKPQLAMEFDENNR